MLTFMLLHIHFLSSSARNIAFAVFVLLSWLALLFMFIFHYHLNLISYVFTFITSNLSFSTSSTTSLVLAVAITFLLDISFIHVYNYSIITQISFILFSYSLHQIYSATSVVLVVPGCLLASPRGLPALFYGLALLFVFIFHYHANILYSVFTLITIKSFFLLLFFRLHRPRCCWQLASPPPRSWAASTVSDTTNYPPDNSPHSHSSGLVLSHNCVSW